MNNKIKVAEFVTRLEFGGVEAMLLNYTSHFENKEQFDLHIITQDINDENCIRQFEKQGFTVHVVTHKRKSILKNIREIYQILKCKNFDVAHSHMTLTNFYVLFLAKVVGVPVRISHAHSAFNDNGIKTKMMYPILKKLNQMVANIWMACGYEAGAFLYGDKAMRTDKVYIARNAIDLKHFQYTDEIRQKIRKQYNLDNQLCVGHVGRFMPPKNHLFVLKIFKSLLKINSNARLLLVGDGELLDQICQYAREMKIKDSIIFTGNIMNVNEMYQAMDGFILPSLYEGLPVVAIETQAAGLPCLISDRVDQRCAMTSCIEFMSIDEPAQTWAEAILHCVEKGRVSSDASIKALTEEGYNIDAEACKLENLYKTGNFQ